MPAAPRPGRSSQSRPDEGMAPPETRNAATATADAFSRPATTDFARTKVPDMPVNLGDRSQPGSLLSSASGTPSSRPEKSTLPNGERSAEAEKKGGINAFPPAPGSIESALASAPRVSPHYVPPPAPEKPAPDASMATIVANGAPADNGEKGGPVSRNAPFVNGSRNSRMPASNLPSAQRVLPGELQGDGRRADLLWQTDGMTGEERQTSRTGRKAAIPAINILQEKGEAVLADFDDAGNFPNDTRNKDKGENHRPGKGEEQLAAKKASEKNWRRMTIIISCIGGLASGWLGSNITDQAGRYFGSSSAGTARENKKGVADIASPLSMKAGAAGSGLGKTDRARPLNEDYCTVLELDRVTGLTLARPCKPVKTGKFNSTLGKADLLAKPN